MNENQVNMLILKGAIGDIPEPDRKLVIDFADELRERIKKDPRLLIAMALVCAEESNKG